MLNVECCIFNLNYEERNHQEGDQFHHHRTYRRS